MSIGQRLKEERGALKMNQTEFAALAGTTKQTLFSWETGKTAPDANELAAFAAHGVDVLYVLTGVRNGRAPEQKASIDWLPAMNSDATDAHDAVKVIGYDHRDKHVLLFAGISNDPDVELCMAGDGEGVILREGHAYVSTAWLAENYPETGDVCAVAEEKVAEYLARRKFDPKTEALLNNYQNLSEQDKDALGRLADSLAQSVTSAADESA